MVVISPWTLPGGNVAPFGTRNVKVGGGAAGALCSTASTAAGTRVGLLYKSARRHPSLHPHACPPARTPLQVGDSVRFEWTQLHGVYRIPSGTCPQVGESELGGRWPGIGRFTAAARAALADLLAK